MTNKAYAETLKNCASMLADGIKYMKEEHQKQFKEAYEKAIKALEQSEWITVNSPEDYPKESGDYLTVLEDTAFHNYKFTDITSFDCDGILAEWNLKPQYEVVAWKYFEPYKGDTE